MASSGAERSARYYARKRAGVAFHAGSLDGIDIDTLRRHIENLTCPWCDDGPFRNLHTHTFLAHGVRGSEMKRVALVPLDKPLVSNDVSDRLSEAWYEHSDQNLALLSSFAVDASRLANEDAANTPLRQLRRQWSACEACGSKLSRPSCGDEVHEGAYSEYRSEENRRRRARLLRLQGRPSTGT